jgi:hypothetical protein
MSPLPVSYRQIFTPFDCRFISECQAVASSPKPVINTTELWKEFEEARQIFFLRYLELEGTAHLPGRIVAYQRFCTGRTRARLLFLRHRSPSTVISSSSEEDFNSSPATTTPCSIPAPTNPRWMRYPSAGGATSNGTWLYHEDRGEENAT